MSDYGYNKGSGGRRQDHRQSYASKPGIDPRVAVAKREAALMLLTDDIAMVPSEPLRSKPKARFGNQGGGNHHPGGRQGPLHGVSPSGPRDATPSRGPVMFKLAHLAHLVTTLLRMLLTCTLLTYMTAASTSLACAPMRGSYLTAQVCACVTSLTQLAVMVTSNTVMVTMTKKPG